MTISEIINHFGEEREKYFNAVSPPIIQDPEELMADFSNALNNL